MTDEKWQQVIGHIKDNFDIINQRTEELPEDIGPGTVEIIEFQGPLGKMKLEHTVQPLVVDKKTIGSRRIGSDVTVEYRYSDTETVNKFKAYRWDDTVNDWIEMTMARGEMIF
ncbi:MAG: hypothetical protein RB292_02215 [Patescibacteria group bacterium]|jgi:hypothetical protein|nr:hypothetical protein [Patescibacteria group bacterium]